MRGHSVDAFLRDNELMAKIYFYRTSKEEEKTSGAYSDQELMLSKYFDMEKWEI